MDTDATLPAIAKRLFDAIETADIESLRALYAPNAQIWMNTTNRAMSASDVTSFLPYLAKRVANRKYADRQVNVFDGGFVQRHRMTGVRRDGAMVSVLVCVVCTVVDGKVTRLEEYCDAAQLKGYME